MQEYLQAFDEEQMLDAAARVNKLAKSLQGRKVEEDDWTDLYCKVKGTENQGWSNDSFRDYVHDGLGVEFKLLKKPNPTAHMGKWVMHPAATRKIDYDDKADAETAMRKIFADWTVSIDEFETRVKSTSSSGTADLRWGILLWATDHTEFLYFEERLVRPNPDNFIAEWHVGQHRGHPTRNLWIFDRENPEIKRFSCTLPKNGAKIQPYFRVPTIEDGAHLFQAERHDTVPLFVGKRDLDRLLNLFPHVEPEEAFTRLLDSEDKRRGSTS